MLLLTALVPKLPPARLHLVPTLITEAVLGTKEVNEKARNAAFDLLIVMGTKMQAGGTISRKLAVGMTEAGDDVPLDDEEMDDAAGDGELRLLQYTLLSTHEIASATANIEEYITMVAAGLAASTPHMISASITALSRLLFEYQGEIPCLHVHPLPPLLT
jgi:ribosomal RNA-processing protein 12